MSEELLDEQGVRDLLKVRIGDMRQRHWAVENGVSETDLSTVISGGRATRRILAVLGLEKVVRYARR